MTYATSIERTIGEVEEDRVIAVVREKVPEVVPSLVRALLAGGIRVIEITMTIPRAVELIRELGASDELTTPEGKGIILGAGSVREPEQIDILSRSGISFAASPTTDRGTIERCGAGGIVMMPGALTPNEILAAHSAGAPVVKLFPLPMEGAGYLASVRAPLPEVRIAPSGGISDENAGELLEAGAWGLNVGSWLTPPGEDLESRCREVTFRARRLREVCAPYTRRITS